MKIGLLTGGGDVPGLNASIKAAVDRAHGRGIEVLGLRRGWAGLLHVDPADPRSLARHTLPGPRIPHVLERYETRVRYYGASATRRRVWWRRRVIELMPMAGETARSESTAGWPALRAR